MTVHACSEGWIIICYKSDTYLRFPILCSGRSDYRIPSTLTLYRETMGSGGEELLSRRESGGETEREKAE